MLIPKLSADLNRFHRVDEKYDFVVYMLVPHMHTPSPSAYFSMKERTPDLWVCREINLLFSQLITSKMHVYQMSVTLSFWWITCITALLPIWFVFLRCADYKITLLMHRFSPSKIDGTDERKGTTNLYQKTLKTKEWLIKQLMDCMTDRSQTGR